MIRLVFGVVFALFSASNAYATLCKEVTRDNNEIIVERAKAQSAELSFWLWPNRNAIRIDAAGLGDKVDIKVIEGDVQRIYDTQQFYVYAGNKESFQKCLTVATKASENGNGLRMKITNVGAGFYDFSDCTGKKSWASFSLEKSTLECEEIN